MSQRLVSVVLLAGFLVLAVLLHRSTASYPAFVQGSTASYVRFLAWSLGVLCVAELGLSWLRERGREAKEEKEKSAEEFGKRFWALLVLLFAYGLSLDPFGFFPASIVFLPVAMFAMGARRPVSIVATTAGILVFIHLVFVELLELHLPTGTLY